MKTILSTALPDGCFVRTASRFQRVLNQRIEMNGAVCLFALLRTYAPCDHGIPISKPALMPTDCWWLLAKL